MRKKMISVLNKIKFGIILIIIECFFYYRNLGGNFELFFIIWSFICLALLIINIVKPKNEGAMPSGVGSHTGTTSNESYIATATFEKKDNKKSRESTFGGISDPMNITYLIFLVVNIVGYIIAMPN